MIHTPHSSRLKTEGIAPGASRQQWALAGLVLLSTVLALLTLALRLFYSGRASYSFLVKDLFLAWVPLWLALVVVRTAGGGRGTGHTRLSIASLVALTGIWVLFLPNAPYLLTEFVHLTTLSSPHAAQQAAGHAARAARPGLVPLLRLLPAGRGMTVPLWYDVFMLLLFAWNGLILGLLSLRMVHQAVCARFGAAGGWAAALLLVLLSGFGVTLGRFQRFNSWDLFSKPGPLLADVAARVLHPRAHPGTAGATLLLSGFLLLAYLTMVALMSEGRGRRDSRDAGRHWVR